MDIMVTVKKRSASVEAKAKKAAINARLRQCMSAHEPPLLSGADLRAACLAKGIKIPATSAASWWRGERHPSEITCLKKLGPGLGFSGNWIWDGIGDMRQGPAPARESMPEQDQASSEGTRPGSPIFEAVKEAFLQAGVLSPSPAGIAATVELAVTGLPPRLSPDDRVESARSVVRSWFAAWRRRQGPPKLQ